MVRSPSSTLVIFDVHQNRGYRLDQRQKGPTTKDWTTRRIYWTTHVPVHPTAQRTFCTAKLSTYTSTLTHSTPTQFSTTLLFFSLNFLFSFSFYFTSFLFLLFFSALPEKLSCTPERRQTTRLPSLPYRAHRKRAIYTPTQSLLSNARSESCHPSQYLPPLFFQLLFCPFNRSIVNMTAKKTNEEAR